MVRSIALRAEPMDDEIDRRSILARRAALIAATMIGLATPSCGDDTNPDDGTAGHGGEPQPCLSPPLGGGGSLGIGGNDGGAAEGGAAEGGAGGEGGMPQACLTPKK
jgi:hypothetical protein